MKAKLLIVLAAVAMLFTACKKDNEIHGLSRSSFGRIFV